MRQENYRRIIWGNINGKRTIKRPKTEKRDGKSGLLRPTYAVSGSIMKRKREI